MTKNQARELILLAGNPEIGRDAAGFYIYVKGARVDGSLDGLVRLLAARRRVEAAAILARSTKH